MFETKCLNLQQHCSWKGMHAVTVTVITETNGQITLIGDVAGGSTPTFGLFFVF